MSSTANRSISFAQCWRGGAKLMRCKVEPMKQVATMIRSHFDRMPASTRSRQTNGFIEAVNGLFQAANERPADRTGNRRCRKGPHISRSNQPRISLSPAARHHTMGVEVTLLLTNTTLHEPQLRFLPRNFKPISLSMSPLKARQPRAHGAASRAHPRLPCYRSWSATLNS